MWFKADDGLHSHPKPRKAGLPAMGLWVLAGTYAMDYRTDGFIPDWFVRSWPRGPELAERLVKSDLWSRATQRGETGWQFHDWQDYQPTADEIDRLDQAKSVGRSRAGQLGMHRRWHEQKGVTKDGCIYCGRPPTDNSVIRELHNKP